MDRIILETNFTEKAWPDDIPYKHVLKQVGPHLFDYVRFDVNGVGWGTRTFYSAEKALKEFLKIVQADRKENPKNSKNLQISAPQQTSASINNLNQTWGTELAKYTDWLEIRLLDANDHGALVDFKNDMLTLLQKYQNSNKCEVCGTTATTRFYKSKEADL